MRESRTPDRRRFWKLLSHAERPKFDPRARLSGSTVVLRGTDLVFFVDEFGDIGCNDPHHPLFGFAGCALFGDEYEQTLREPWLSMKRAHFGGRDRRLHFSQMRALGRRRRDALAEFLRSNRCFVFGSSHTRSSDLPHELTEYETGATALLARMVETAEKAALCGGFSGIVVVFEATEKLDPLHHSFFTSRGLTEGLGKQVLPIPTYCYRLLGDAGEPGLEIADLLGHSIGRQVRLWESGSDAGWLPEFRSLIQGRDPALVSSLQIKQAVVNVRRGSAHPLKVPPASDCFPLVTEVRGPREVEAPVPIG